LAQESSSSSENEAGTGTVRVRSVDNAETIAESETGNDVASVAAREMPVSELARAVPTAGDSIVAFALQYVGYPYVWAGNTPAGFDCSGFTQFVILNVVGIDIGHGIGGQPGAGAWVDAGALLPGDLVFFQNTYQPGLSHAGIYIGDGLFVHAENEGTGVVVTAIWSDYYGPRFWGAVRVG
jgi:cell wall-associated NlpC family hydrolase